MTSRASALPIDFEEQQTGMMVGKAAALADWQFKREQKAFAVVVNRLRVLKWQRENVAKKRANGLRWFNAKPERAERANDLSRKRRLTDRMAKPDAMVYACAECGAEWCLTPRRPRRGPPPSFCGTRCYQRNRARAKGSVG